MAFLAGRVRKGEPTQAEAIGFVFLCGGLALWLHVSYLLAAVVMGATVANVARHHERPFHTIEGIEWPFMILFFVLSGASLQLDALAAVGWLGLGYVLLRTLGRIAGAALGTARAKASPVVRMWMGTSLLPQAGVAIALTLTAAQQFPVLAEVLLPVALGATVLFEVVKHVKGASDVTALRLMGKPYLEVKPNRHRMARYGLRVEDVQRIIEVALGGMPQSRSVEGRERYPIRVRYARAWREDIDVIRSTPVPVGKGAYVPLSAVADFEVTAGPAMIRGEGGQLVGYVMFNAQGRDEVGLVEEADKHLQEMVARGDIEIPNGVYWDWRGRYQNQVRAAKRLSILIPLCLLANLLLHFLHFGRLGPSLIVFLGIPVALSGGFILLDFYGAYLTVAVWVGFIAVFGIAADDGIVIGTYIQQVIRRRKPTTVEGVRAAVLEAGRKRIRPALMTSVTTILALIPIFLTEGRGSDVMRPMALPSIGGMIVAAITWFVVPMAYSAIEERRILRSISKTKAKAAPAEAHTEDES